MSYRYEHGHLAAGGVLLAGIAERAGTPCYVYSADMIRDRFRAYDRALAAVPHTVCYAVKANSNLAILKLLAGEGAGFDIVSAGELYRVLKAGGDPATIVFSGVGKTAAEIEFALDRGIFGFNCESEAELALIDALAARRGVKARVAVRVNPDVDASTHPYISTGLRDHKFGIDIAEAEEVYERARVCRNLSLDSVSCHIGSQILDPAPVLQAVDRVLELIERLRARGFEITHADLGGGLGVAYQAGQVTPSIEDYGSELARRLAGRDLSVMIEPGRSIVGEAGVLLTRVLYRKRSGSKEFVVVDGAMNDLIRPSLYQAWHDIIPLREPRDGVFRADVVGPVCESGDFFARDRELAEVLPGDLVAVMTSGAYGFVQSSNYNSRPRAAEVLIEGDSWRIVRTRETFEDLIRGECLE